MPQRYLMTMPKVRTYGTYEYLYLDLDEAVKWLRGGRFINDIRLPKLTRILHDLTGFSIYPNREGGPPPTLQPGDEALIFSVAMTEQYHSFGEMPPEYIYQAYEFGLFRRLDEEALSDMHTDTSLNNEETESDEWGEWNDDESYNTSKRGKKKRSNAS